MPIPRACPRSRSPACRTATSRSYFTVFQQVGDFPLQPVASGRYRDRFERRDGAWRFTSREVSTDLVGDVSHHVKVAI